MITLKWEDVQSEPNLSVFLRRARVPGGWLIMSVDDVRSRVADDRFAVDGYEWRSSLAFVPDPGHKWMDGIDDHGDPPLSKAV